MQLTVNNVFQCLDVINFLLLPLAICESLSFQKSSRIFLYSGRKNAQFIPNTAGSIIFQLQMWYLGWHWDLRERVPKSTGSVEGFFILFYIFLI